MIATNFDTTIEEPGPAKFPPRISRATSRNFLTIGLSVSIPLIILSIIFGYRSSTQERKIVELQAIHQVDRAAQSLEAMLMEQVQDAQPLINLKRLDHDDISSFQEHAIRLKTLHPDWASAVLALPSGQQLVSSEGPRLGSSAGINGFAQAVETGRPVVGGFSPPGTIAPGAAFPIHVPVDRNGVVRYVVTIVLLPSQVERILAAAELPSDWEGAVIDANGRIVAHTRNHGAHDGAPASQFFSGAAGQDIGAFREDMSAHSGPIYAVTQSVSGNGWSLYYGIPRQVLDHPVNRAWRLMVIASGGTLILTGILVSLVAHYIAGRRRVEIQKAEEVLRVSEAWRLLAVEVADIGTWHWDIPSDQIEWCDRCRQLLGIGPGAVDYSMFLAAVHPEHRKAVDAATRRFTRHFEPYEIDFRALLPDGNVRWLRASGQAPYTGQDEPKGVYGVIINIHRQKLAEAERRILLSRLTSAQEDERRRIARELHDRVGQSVIGLSLGFKRLEGDMATPSSKKAYAELKTMILEISRDIHRAAVELRPTALDDIGLQDALTAYLGDWTGRSGIAVEVYMDGLDGARLPPFIETTAYRIVVELFTNIERHSAAGAVSLTIDRRPEMLNIVVEDNGRGFEEPLATARQPLRHLGLLGIRERLELVGGELTIESEIGMGTSAFVRIPVAPLGGATA